MSVAIAFFAGVCALSSADPPAEAPSVQRPPSTPIADRYPGDQGIERDSAVLFADSFEADSLDTVTNRWTEVSNQGGRALALDTDNPLRKSGQHSLKITATPGENTGGHLYLRLPRQVDSAHFRFYVKFPDPASYIHHFVHMGGYHPATNWPQGGAGSRPEGNDRFTVGIEPFGRDGRVPAPGEWNFYTYWHEMKVSADRRYWGNGLRPHPPQPVPVNRWQCVEVKIRMNDPGSRNGTLALWLDGKPVADIREGTPRRAWTGLGFDVAAPGDGEPFEGFDFRTSADLKLNFFWLLHYVTEESTRRNRAEPRPSSVWFDHIVVATDYIGPIQAR